MLILPLLGFSFLWIDHKFGPTLTLLSVFADSATGISFSLNGILSAILWVMVFALSILEIRRHKEMESEVRNIQKDESTE